MYVTYLSISSTFTNFNKIRNYYKYYVYLLTCEPCLNKSFTDRNSSRSIFSYLEPSELTSIQVTLKYAHR